MQVQTRLQEQPSLRIAPPTDLAGGGVMLPGTQLHVQVAPGGIGEPQGRV